MSSSISFVQRGGLLILLAFAGASVTAAELVIESRPQGLNFTKYSEPLGAWRDSDNPPHFAKSAASGLTAQGKAGSRKLVVSGTSRIPGSPFAGTARFTPDVPAAGRYYVYATWPKGGNAMPVHYVIRHANGSDTLSLMQDGFARFSRYGNGDKWHPLGVYDFSPGTDQYVEIQVPADTQAPHTRNAVQAFSDAVCFSSEPLSSAADKSAAAIMSPDSGSPAAAAGAAIETTWLESLESAMTLAGRDQKKILVFFFSPGNPQSDETEALLANPAVRAVLQAHYVPVRISIKKDAELAAKMHAYRAGTINLYSSRGDSLGQITTPEPAPALAARLGSM